MRFALLVLALSVLSLSEASDFKQLPLLTRVGDTAGHTFSSSETSLSCLRVAAAPYCHYGEPDGLSIGVIRTEMSCCQAQATQDMFWPHLAAAGVGDCDFTVTYAYSMPGPTSKQLSGSYSMLCFLDSTASDCMDTVCDNMIMSSQGSVYHLEGDLVTDDPSLPQFQACWLKYPLPRMAGARPQPRCKRSSSNSSPGAKTPKGVPSHHGTRRLQAAQQGSGVYHVVDNADILSGPLTVRDPATGQTWNGWLQATFFMHSPATGGTGSGRVDPGCEPLALADELLTEAEAAGKFLVRPSEVNIRLFTGPATA